MTWLDTFLARPLPTEPWDETLETLCAALGRDDAQALREERAGILEYEAGLPTEEAENKAGL